MKILFFFPELYSIKEVFIEGCSRLGINYEFCHFEDFFSNTTNRWQSKITNLPRSLKNIWSSSYIQKVNKLYLKKVQDFNPDLVLLYNDQLMLPETAKHIKKKCPIFNFLGDNPFYVFQRPFNLATIREMDYVFAPDSHWLKQLNQIGIEKTSFLVLGYANSINFFQKPTIEEKEKYASDVVMIGRTYNDAWGYKRALFYNKFSHLDFKIYGNGWNRWLNHFPELKDSIVPLKQTLSHQDVNLICNCCKIYPIDANPGLINGLHIRIFDSIGTGILPLVEYRHDLQTVFKGNFVPVIDNYNQAADIAAYYLKNEKERKDIVSVLKRHVDINYNPKIAVEKIIDKYEKVKN